MCLMIVAPCFIIFYKVSTLHINCKCLLLYSLTTHSFLLVSQLFVAIHGILEILHPEIFPYETVKDWFALAHQAAYCSSCFITLWMIAERCYASFRLESYESARRPVAAQVFAVLLTTIPPGILLGFVADYWVLLPLGLVVIGTVETTSVILSMLLYVHRQRKYARIQGKASLTARYQMMEVLEYSRSVLPACIIAAALRSAGFVPALLWITGCLHMETIRAFFIPIHAISGVVMKQWLIFSHRGLRKTAINYYGVIFDRKPRVVTPVKISPHIQTEQYFQQFKAAW